MGTALRYCFLIQSLLLSGLASLSAQTLLVQVSQLESGDPIAGAFVSLYRQDSVLVRHALTNSQGQFLFQAGMAGSFTVRVQMIGREVLERGGILVGPGEDVNLDLQLPVNPIPLRGIQVEAEEKCRLLPEEASVLSLVWEEARKALMVQEWTEEEGAFSFQVVNYERDMDVEDRFLGREARQISTGVSSNPIRSLPARELMEGGFVQQLPGGGWEFWGPDATVLLSDQFLNTHCFHLQSNPNEPGALGLAFEPFEGTEKTDIFGTLWLDRETGALQFLDYEYSWGEFPQAPGIARGHVEFEGLPNGAWIVRRWWIRMPRLSQDLTGARVGRSDVFVSGIRESGGRVDRITSPDRHRVGAVQVGVVEGVVWDSTETGPLEGAEVYLSGTSHSTVTDAEGRFRLDDVPRGSYLVAFAHPGLDAMGVFSRGVEVEITSDSTSTASLSIPSLLGIYEQTCPAEEREMGPGFLTGVVRDRSSGRPIPDATVTVRWDEFRNQGFGSLAYRARVHAQTDSEGRYCVCGLPVARRISLQATYLDWEGDRESVMIPWEDYPVVDLEIDLSGFKR